MFRPWEKGNSGKIFLHRGSPTLEQLEEAAPSRTTTMSEEKSTGSKEDSIPEEQLKFLLREVRQQSILHWNYCRLKSLPPELVEEAGHVQQLNLKCNLLSTLPDNIGKLSGLTSCTLNNNSLQSLPEAIGDLVSLEVLDVGNNFLETLPLSLARLPSLRLLVAAHNHLAAFPPELCTMKSLSILMLSCNRLTELPDAVGGLSGLQCLHIDHNQLRELPRPLATLPILVRVSCCCNPLRYLPFLPFTSQPKIFFDSCPHLNYLTLSVVQQQRSGNTWDPILLQTCGCFQDSGLEKTAESVDVYIDRAVKPGCGNGLVLPSQLHTVTSACPGTVTVTSLRELCLRYIWKESQRIGIHDSSVGASGDDSCEADRLGDDRMLDVPGNVDRIADVRVGDNRMVDIPEGVDRIADIPIGDDRMVDVLEGIDRIAAFPGDVGDDRMVDIPEGVDRIAGVPVDDVCMANIDEANECTTQTPKDECKAQIPKDPLAMYKDSLPGSLWDSLRGGPIALCDRADCREPILTFTSILVLPVNISTRLQAERQRVPLVMLFCCDACSQQNSHSVKGKRDDFSVWLCGRLENQLKVEFT